MSLPEVPSVVKLKKGAERRILHGHLWIFSNEVDTAATPLTAFEAGQLVSVEARNGRSLGIGYINPASLISVRLMERDVQDLQGFDREQWLKQKLENAFSLRQLLFSEPYYRLVHGEGDLLPGLVIDRFDETAIVQITTAGMEVMKETLIRQLVEIAGVSVVHLDNRSTLRTLENLETDDVTPIGTLPEKLVVQENGANFEVAAGSGQKTGWYFDHRENRALAARLASGKTVLDVFSYVGGWSIQAACAGATNVTAIDASQKALSRLEANARDNGVADRVEAVCGDALEILKQLGADGKSYDLVILDPPAFIKRRKDFKKGVQHYELLNRLAARLVNNGGVLITASCSQAMPGGELEAVARRAARKSGKELQILHQLSQSPDHPWLAGVPETFYLKGLVARLIAG